MLTLHASVTSFQNAEDNTFRYEYKVLGTACFIELSRCSHPSTSKKSTAAFPSSSSLVATHDYYQRHLGSTPSDSSSASAKYPGEATFYHSGLPKAHLAHQWASFFSGKFTLWFMATVLESPEHLESPQASSGTRTCHLAQEATRKQPGGQSCKANLGPHPE
ncbi:pancreatic progenitor cell differentiation and proliferation factor-like [Myotis myotis]|uniref:pancreatic progenitor cell differentiation and proliferation factor-like n=1 Tax=Myotis myotis TaxID=51298 RepID=UPI00174C21BF|nr:pancreatic progenitor cell differentiation and proliferation factor-like [Myotis myotis]